MPHVTIEYSSNLDTAVDIDRLCRAIHEAMLASGLFEIGAVRVRALRAEHYAVADLDPRNGFVDISVRIGTGRSDADKKAVGDTVNQAAEAELASVLAAPHFALSLELREIDAALSWKTNPMHGRLRRQGERSHG